MKRFWIIKGFDVFQHHSVIFSQLFDCYRVNMGRNGIFFRLGSHWGGFSSLYVLRTLLGSIYCYSTQDHETEYISIIICMINV